MKKVFASILALLYFVTTTGATINLHYCMDKLVDQSLWHDEQQQCSKCGMEKMEQQKGCCNDEQKQIKLQNDHYLADANFPVVAFSSFAIPVSFSETQFLLFSAIGESHAVCNAPPRSCDIPIFKRNCVFRI